MRSLTLARALEVQGAQVAFAATPFVSEVLDRFAPDVRREDGDPQAVGAFDAIVFDHFGLGAADHRRFRRDRPAMAIDDLADRPMAVEVLLDAGPERTAADYEGLAPRARLLLGPRWALVRPPFAAARQSALARREAGGEVGRVLVSMGLTDVGGITGRIVQRLLPRTDATLDVVVGPAAPSLEALKRLSRREPRVRLHESLGAEAMAALCAEADLAVGAGGSTTWERCVLGLPAVVVVLAGNQQPGARAVAHAGAAECVDARTSDFEAALDRSFTGLVRSPERRKRMARQASALCDGQGAERAAREFLAVMAGAS